MIPYGLISVNAYSIPNENEFAAKIADLQSRFVDGKYWNKYSSSDYSRTGDTPCTGYGLTSHVACTTRGYCADSNGQGCTCLCGAYVLNGVEKAWQCMGFAYKMGHECFGVSPYSWDKTYSLGTVYAGDIIRINNDFHTIFVYKVDGSTIYYADCNRTGPCRVSWGNTYSYSELSSRFKAKDYKLHLSGNNLSGNGTGGSGIVDLGTDFYALITNNGSSNCLTAEDDGNVDICRYAYSQTLMYSQKQWWKFFKHYDGSYFIRSVETGKYLECENGGWQNGTNIVIRDATWSDAQKWEIIPCGNGYQLKSKCTDCVMEMNAWDFYQGVNCVSGYRDGSSAEVFNLYIRDFDKVKIPSLGTKNNKGIVEFFWENGECTTNYNIKIWRGDQIQTGEAPINIWNPKNNSYNACLDVGTYTAYIEGYNVFGDYVKAQPITFYVTYSRADLGTDFYAAITHKDSWTLLTAEDDGNVDICRYAYSPTLMYSQKQWWKFFRQNDGSYIIKSAETGKCLECQNGGNQNGTNVIINDENNTDAQKWYIYQTTDGCQLQAKCTDCVIEMNSSEFYQCVNCISGTRDNSKAEKFVIDTLGFDYMRKPRLDVEINDNTAVFTWKHGECTTNYNIKIWQGNSDLPGESPINLWNVKNNSITLSLDKGKYTAYIEGYNPLGDYAQSTPVSFTINKQLHKIGDTNFDGHISISDVTAIQRHLAELAVFNDEQLALADTNGDGNVDIADATHLQMYLAEYGVVLGKQ